MQVERKTLFFANYGLYAYKHYRFSTETKAGEQHGFQLKMVHFSLPYIKFGHFGYI